MKFLDVFNEIDKGNYALTDEAIYASLQNGDELIPLYGGIKEEFQFLRKRRKVQQLRFSLVKV